MKINPTYLKHPLNKSPSKQSYSFSKDPRFKHKKTYSQAIYNIASLNNSRSTTFGFGNRQNYIPKQACKTPSPDRYYIPSPFDQYNKQQGRKRTTKNTSLSHSPSPKKSHGNIKKQDIVISIDKLIDKVKNLRNRQFDGNIIKQVGNIYNLKQKNMGNNKLKKQIVFTGNRFQGNKNTNPGPGNYEIYSQFGNMRLL